MQFALSKQPAKIDSFNPRAEKHGDENVPAGDLKFSLKAHSSSLDSFCPSYRKFLFRTADSAGDQPSLPMGSDVLTALAKPNLKPLVLDEDFPGYTLRIGSGLDTGQDIVIKDVELSSFRFEAIDGGSVAISFSASFHPSEDQAGALSMQVQNVVDITLEPPMAAEQQLAA